MSQDNMGYIYLVWKDSIKRMNHIVGKLSRNGMFEFEYIKASCEKLENFEPLVAFPDLDAIYRNKNMFASFAARLPDKRRPEIKSILARYNLKEYDEFELLKKTGAALPIDRFFFIEPIDLNESFIERNFFIAKTRHHDSLDYGLKVGDILDLEVERYDVKVNFNNTFIGYVPSYFSKEVTQCIKEGRKVQCKVIYVNPDKEQCQECVKVKLNIE